MKNGGVVISGSFYAGGDVVGGDKITGGGGAVACDFIWRGAVVRGTCLPADQRAVQNVLDMCLDGNIPYELMLARVRQLSPSLASQIERIERDRK
jgi:hypothetical protein